MAGKNVRMIPATKVMHTGKPLDRLERRKVAAYARVSTDSDEQFTSYEAQIDYYTKMIKSHHNWDFVKVYTDEGISGTNTKYRDGFNSMIEDALSGKMDLIVTKSVSRFARNTVDSLVTVRNLKEKGVEVYFEKENIYTLDSKGELLITIMSSLAQEESRSISENVTWGIRKRFSDGKVILPYKRFLGYEKGPDGLPQIVEDEAKIVRQIYDMFLSGKSIGMICDALEEMGIPSPGGKESWSMGTVYSMLQNEKYKGAALLQKEFTTDFLTKKRKVNEGEVPQYYVENSHPAIIDPKLWELTQIEIERRKSVGKRYSASGLFAGRIVCGECGSFYGPRSWKNKKDGRRTVWRCGKKYGNDNSCDSAILTEEEIKEKFVSAFNEIYDDREVILEGCRELLADLDDNSDIDEKIREHELECEILADMNLKIMKDSAITDWDKSDARKQIDLNVRKYEEKYAMMEKLRALKQERIRRTEKLSLFMFGLLDRGSMIEDFDEKLWITTVDRVEVQADGRMEFHFKNGTEVTR